MLLRSNLRCTSTIARIAFPGRSSQRLFSQQADTKKQFDAYCFNSVRSADYESFLFGLMCPKQYREVFFAVHAFNIEIATIQDQIPRNSIQAGRLRFQFWKDSFQQIYFGKGLSSSNNQPVAQALNYYIPQHNLTLRWFERSLEARFQDMMKPGNFETMDDLETYAEYSQSPLMYLMLEAMAVKDEGAEFAASHLGVCRGILTLLRGYLKHRSLGVCYFPREVMDRHGLRRDVAVRGPSTEAEAATLREVVFDIASQAHAHLDKARELSAKGLPKGVHFALMPGVGSSLYLDQLRKQNFTIPADIDERSQHIYHLRLQLNILVYLLTKRM